MTVHSIFRLLLSGIPVVTSSLILWRISTGRMFICFCDWLNSVTMFVQSLFSLLLFGIPLVTSILIIWRISTSICILMAILGWFLSKADVKRPWTHVFIWIYSLEIEIYPILVAYLSQRIEKVIVIVNFLRKFVEISLWTGCIELIVSVLMMI